jgi:hypothetical protein
MRTYDDGCSISERTSTSQLLRHDSRASTETPNVKTANAVHASSGWLFAFLPRCNLLSFWRRALPRFRGERLACTSPPRPRGDGRKESARWFTTPPNGSLNASSIRASVCFSRAEMRAAMPASSYPARWKPCSKWGSCNTCTLAHLQSRTRGGVSRSRRSAHGCSCSPSHWRHLQSARVG